MDKENAILMGPFVGELYWEAGRFAPMLPNIYQKYRKTKKKHPKYIVLTREDRFDLYGRFADILVPLRIPGDYEDKYPECFRLVGLAESKYKEIIKQFKEKYQEKYNIIKHVYPDIRKGQFGKKDQFPQSDMMFDFKPRQENYNIVENYLPNDKPIVVLSPRFRKGFKRNWNHWPEFYDMIIKDDTLTRDFYFIICGKKGEYIPDPKKRFLDLNDMILAKSSSLIGLLLVILEKAFFTFGSQSAIPNLALLYKVDVLEFGCQKMFHTRTYNIHKSPITFIVDKRYNIPPIQIFPKFKDLLYNKRRKENAANK
ncbi:MAG: hypothetical protein K9L62_10320 [Vallitaleaceae bacterium]|nr:hypothetical protein [Vallitaleaceae bacterium]